MLIGIRKIRSAGHASGSIEITLPPELAPLEGADCRILLRDGARPEIALQPDLAPAVAVFARIWAHLRSLLKPIGDIGDFPIQEFEVVLLPTEHHSGRMLLVYSQAWQVSRAVSPTATGGERYSRAVAEALSGVVAPLGVVAGRRLGLTGAVAAAFGASLASLAVPSNCSSMADLDSFEDNMTRRAWLEACGHGALLLNVLGPQPDEAKAHQALRRIVGQFRMWQERPDQHELGWAQWCQDLGAWTSGSLVPAKASSVRGGERPAASDGAAMTKRRNWCYD